MLCLLLNIDLNVISNISEIFSLLLLIQTSFKKKYFHPWNLHETPDAKILIRIRISLCSWSSTQILYILLNRRGGEVSFPPTLDESFLNMTSKCVKLEKN